MEGETYVWLNTCMHDTLTKNIHARMCQYIATETSGATRSTHGRMRYFRLKNHLLHLVCAGGVAAAGKAQAVPTSVSTDQTTNSQAKNQAHGDLYNWETQRLGCAALGPISTASLAGEKEVGWMAARSRAPW